jgi:hypothetical protein
MTRARLVADVVVFFFTTGTVAGDNVVLAGVEC